MDYRDAHGATGQLVAGAFIAYPSQDHADRLSVADEGGQAPKKPRDSHTTSDKTPEDERTVAQLKEALDAGGHEYDHNARRADLVALAAQHGV